MLAPTRKKSPFSSFEPMRMFSVLVLLLTVFSLGGFVPEATAQPRCVPEADGVPYTSPDTPVWWDADGDGTLPEYPQEDDRVDDPRWHGAYGYGHGGGTTGGVWNGGSTADQVQFRALHHTTGGTTYMYLSWVVKTAPTLSAPVDARTFVGFHQSGGGDDVILEFRRTSSSPTTPSSPNSELNSSDIQVRVHQPDGSPNGWSNTDVSSWVDGAKARMWAAGAGDPSPYTVGSSIVNNRMWAIQVRIPLTSGGDPTSQSTPQVPINPSQPFNFWYEAWVPISQQAGGITDAAQYPFLGNNYITKLNPNDPLSPLQYPATSNWPQVKLANSATSAGCNTTGVSLSRSDIGTTNTPRHEFQLRQSDQPNTLFAAPMNMIGSTIGQNALAATFRIANWGSQPWTGSLQNPDEVWTEIPSGVGRPNPSPIPSGGKGNITFNWNIDRCTACEFQNYYSNNTSSCNANCTGLPTPKRTPHQCLLVELENNAQSASLTFLNQSVYRNMDFVQTSTFRRSATISVQGLRDGEPRPEGDGRRVLLFEEKQNLYLEADSLALDELVLPPAVYGQLDVEGRLAAREEPTMWESAARDTSVVDLVDRQLPTYRVYVYRGTGLEIQEEDPEHRVRLLRPQTPFGYYAYHSGPLEGWRTRLSGETVERLGPRVHQLSVPEDGRVMVQNTIQAVEPGEEPINEGDEIDRRLMDAEAEDGEGEQEEQDGGEQGGVQDSCGSSSGILLLAGLAFIGFVAHRRRRRG